MIMVRKILKRLFIKLGLLNSVYEIMDDIEWIRLKYFVSKNDYKYAVNYIKKRGKENYNINFPITFDEKLWWLKLNNRNPLLTKCTDKFMVREYVKECGLQHILVKIYAKYDKAEQIDFDKLPDEFIIKANHVSGGNVICTDKESINKKEVIRKYKKLLKKNYYLKSREWNYKDIKPCIIIEELLKEENNSPIIDYKFMCFNGDAKLLFLDTGVAGIDGSHSRNYFRNIYDMDFKRVDMKETRDSIDYNLIKKPDNFSEMINIAEKLSKPFPHCRVDLYNVNGNIYFGEITFYHGGGVNNIEPYEKAIEMGNWIELDKIGIMS